MRRNHLNMRHFKIYMLIYIQQRGLAVTLKKIIMKELDIRVKYLQLYLK